MWRQMERKGGATWLLRVSLQPLLNNISKGSSSSKVVPPLYGGCCIPGESKDSALSEAACCDAPPSKGRAVMRFRESCSI